MTLPSPCLQKEREIWMCSGGFLSQAAGNSSTQSLWTWVLHDSGSRDQVQKRLLCTKVGTQSGQPDLLRGRHPLGGAKWQQQLWGKGRRREGHIHHGLSKPARTSLASPPPSRPRSMPRSPAAPGAAGTLPPHISWLPVGSSVPPAPDPEHQCLHFHRTPMWFLSRLKAGQLSHKELSRNTDPTSDPGPATHQVYKQGHATQSLSLTEKETHDTTCESRREDQMRRAAAGSRALDFPGAPVIKIRLAIQGMWVW